VSLVVGTKLGPYEVLAPLGAGGMGEVYKARDTRLGRDVAIKVLPQAFAADPDRLVRFEREARAASALSDPHIVAVYDVGREGETHYFVSELVEGSDLRNRLELGGLATKKALELAEQIASGLAAAHEKGIVHRDLKPENILITKSGLAKIADFGLAKLTEVAGAGVSELPTSDGHQTTAGVVMGTVAYMSPEQARGGAVDFRSDQFSFGSIFYEMLTGKQAFKKGSAPETLSAIIRDEPESIAQIAPGVAAPVAWIVERCLAKDPQERFVSTRDLARDLSGIRQHLSESTPSATFRSSVPLPRKRAAVWVLAGSAVLVAIAAAGILGRRSAVRAWPSFQQLTFRRGTVTAARFAPDGETVVYSALWEGKPGEIFSVRPASPESRSLGVSDGTLLAVSHSEELAVKLHPRLWTGQFHGTLARVPLGGGVPREIMKNVQEADWNREGSDLALLRVSSSGSWVEFPRGKVLYKAQHIVVGLRISPDGKKIALDEGQARHSIILLDFAGKKRVLAVANRITGMAWSRAGDEIWFSADDSGGASSLWAVDLSGRKRLVLRHAGSIRLRDISRNGAVLVSVGHRQSGVMAFTAGAARESDLSWLDATQATGISADGRTLLLNETAVGGGEKGAFYIRKTDGSPAVRLGDGLGYGLSPDGKWVLAQLPGSETRLMLVPIGAGEPRTIEVPIPVNAGWFFPDGRRILANGDLPNGTTRLFSVDLDGKSFRQVAPDGVDTFIGEMPISPDGNLIDGQKGGIEHVDVQLFPAEGGVSRPVRGFEPDDVVVRWAADGHSLFVFKRNQLPARVFRLDLETGKRVPWLELMPADAAGVTRIPIVVMTPDGKSYAYNLTRDLSDLYLIRGLK
jgi:eukaryotic-like serine/threonine-protein kinase